MSTASFEIVKSCGRWKWQLVHNNGTVLAKSGVTYSRRSDAKRAVTRAKSAATVAELTETT